MHPEFVNFDEEEEVTVIHELTCLKSAPLKTYIVVPILSLMSGFIFAICLYWSVPLKVKFFYNKTNKLTDATHMLVEGHNKTLEIQPLYRSTQNGPQDTFSFRFIQFKFDGTKFQSVLFDCCKDQHDLLTQNATGLKQSKVSALRMLYGPC